MKQDQFMESGPIICQLYAGYEAGLVYGEWPIICQLYVSYEAGLVYGEWTYYMPVICQL